MTKYERIIKRKEDRRAEADQNRRDVQKKHDKESKAEKKLHRHNRPATYRRDQNGNIILFGGIIVSKTSGIVLAIIFGSIAFILIGGNSAFEMDEYVEFEFSYAECELFNFENEMCMYYYKFCHEYADGGVTCKYAETDPFADVPGTAVKWLPGEQDFLPPATKVIPEMSDDEWEEVLDGMGRFILSLVPSIPEAEARESNEPVCYTAACEANLAKSGEIIQGEGVTFETLQEKIENTNTSEELNEIVEDIRSDITTIKLKIRILEKTIREFDLNIIKYRNDVSVTKKWMEEAEEIYKDARTDYRHSEDVTIRTEQDRLDNDKIYDDYKISIRELESLVDKYDLAVYAFDEEHDTHQDNKRELVQKEIDLRSLLDDLVVASTKANLVYRDHQFVNIILSKTCLIQIKYGFNTECPTYRELFELFDNTIPAISGEFIDMGYDIKRLPTKYNQHWKYYEQIPWWKVVTVDPNGQMLKRGILITIQPHSFTFTEDVSGPSKTPSINPYKSEMYTWSDIKVTDRCSKVMVSPDTEKIGEAILHVLAKCSTPLNNMETTKIDAPTSYTYTDSPAYQYFEWVKQTVKNIKQGFLWINP